MKAQLVQFDGEDSSILGLVFGGDSQAAEALIDDEINRSMQLDPSVHEPKNQLSHYSITEIEFELPEIKLETTVAFKLKPEHQVALLSMCCRIGHNTTKLTVLESMLAAIMAEIEKETAG